MIQNQQDLSNIREKLDIIYSDQILISFNEILTNFLSAIITDQTIESLLKDTISMFLGRFFGLKLLKVDKLLIKLGLYPSLKLYEIPVRKLYFLQEFLNRELKTYRLIITDLYLEWTYIKNLKTNRAMRRLKGLPVNGQRTSSNGRTSKLLYKKQSFIIKPDMFALLNKKIKNENLLNQNKPKF